MSSSASDTPGMLKSRNASPPLHVALPPPISSLPPSMQRALVTFVVYTLAAYVIWVLFGVVAWVTYIGTDAEAVGLERYFDLILPGGADPGRMNWARKNAAANTNINTNNNAIGGTANINTSSAFSTDLFEYLTKNLPLGILFIIQHSFFTVKRLRSRQFGSLSAGVARLTYCLCSAIILHIFMIYYRNDTVGSWMSRSILILPVSREAHFWFSSACMVFAVIAFCRAPETWALFGVAQILGWNEQEIQSAVAQPVDGSAKISANASASSSTNRNSTTTSKAKKKREREASINRSSAGSSKNGKKPKPKDKLHAAEKLGPSRSGSLTRSISETGARAESPGSNLNAEDPPRLAKTLSESSVKYQVPGIGLGAKTASGSDLAKPNAEEESSENNQNPEETKSDDSDSDQSSYSKSTTSSRPSPAVSPDGIFSRLTDSLTNRYRVPSVGMDAISWMGLTVVR
jgi:hypothetical protein